MLQSFAQRLTAQSDRDQFLQILAFEGEGDSQVCSRVFAAGDVIYHCNTCAYDESCVFCKDCFVHDQHEGHSVTFSQSSGNGGCCDCGDPESWKNAECALPCGHKVKEGFGGLQIFPQVLEFFENVVVGELIGNLACAFDISPRGNGQLWIVLLYNDEMHSYDQVIGITMKVLGVSRSEGEAIAQSVDKCGRIAVFQSESRELAVEKANLISKTKLYTRVVCEEQYKQEMLAFEALKALIHICKFAQIREQVNRALFSAFTILGGRINDKDPDQSQVHLPGGFVQQEYLIVDYFILTENVLWKEFRALLVEFFITCPLSDVANYKIQFSKRFAEFYPELFGIYQKEREPECSIINFSVQIFTGPLIAGVLVKETSLLQDIICGLFGVFKPTLREDQQVVNPTHKSLRNKRFYQLFNDLGHLVSHESVQRAFSRELKELAVQGFCLFEGMCENKRALGAHLEYEVEAWIYAYNIALRIAPLIHDISHCFTVEDLPWIMDYYLSIPGIRERKGSFYHPLQWLVGAILRREGEAFEGTLGESFTVIVRNCLNVQIMVGEIESNLWVRNGLSINREAYGYFCSDLYEFMFCQDWNLLKFFAQTSAFLGGLEGVEFESASHLQEIIVLVARLISRSDHDSPRMIMLHALAEGPVRLSDLIENMPDCVASHRQKQFDFLLEELAEKKGKKFQLKSTLLAEVDLFHCSVHGKKNRTNIVEFGKENGVNVHLNDIWSETGCCLRMLVELEGKLALVPEEWLRECSDVICCLVLRIRKQLPNYAQCILDKLPQNSATVQRAFSLCNGTVSQTGTMRSSKKPAFSSLENEKSQTSTGNASKKRAVEVQKAILEQMHQAQAAFLQTESAMLPEPTSPDTLNCIVCQEALESKPFGFWSKMERVNYSKWSLIQPATGYFYSTCGHSIHLECFDACTQFSSYVKNEIDPFTGAELDFQIFTCPICQRMGNVLIPSVHNGFDEAAFLSFKGVRNEWNDQIENVYTSLLIQFQVAEMVERVEEGECYKFGHGPDARIVNPMICYLEAKGMDNVVERLKEDFKLHAPYRVLLEHFLVPEGTHELVLKDQSKLPALMPMEPRLDQLISRLSALKCPNCPVNDCDYAICMICLQVCCPRKLCCSKGPFGECFCHRSACGFDTVPFFWVKKCRIFVCGAASGSFCPVPYVDERWGEEVLSSKTTGTMNKLNSPKYRRFVKAWLCAELVDLVCAGEAVSVGNGWFSI